MFVQERQLQTVIGLRVETEKQLTKGSGALTSPSALHAEQIIEKGTYEIMVQEPMTRVHKKRNNGQTRRLAVFRRATRVKVIT